MKMKEGHYFCSHWVHIWENSTPLTFFAVNLKVRRGRVVVHVVLVDLFVEALSLLQPKVLCQIIVQRCLGVVRFR